MAQKRHTTELIIGMLREAVDELKVSARDPTFNLTAYHFHNNSILSSIEFGLRPNGADFVWLGEAKSRVPSGSCSQFVALE